MENILNNTPKKVLKYYDPNNNDYSLKQLPSYLNNFNSNQAIKKISLSQNQNSFLLNKFQNKNLLERINKNPLKKNDLTKFNTQKSLRRLNINIKKSNNYTLPEDDKIIFAKKRNMYTNNNGKIKIANIKNINISNDTIAKKIQNKYLEGNIEYKKLNNNYNPKFYTTNNNNIIIENNNNNNHKFRKNIFQKRSSNNLIRYNFDLNSTMPNKPLKNSNFNSGNILSNVDNKYSINQNKDPLKNDSLNFESDFISQRRANKFSNVKPGDDYKFRKKNIRNDYSWDLGISILNKGPKMNFYQKNFSHNINNNGMISNYLSDRKKQLDEIEKDSYSDDIDDKDIDEIVENLNLSFFNDEKQNKTVILNEKGFSDDSLSDIADDIVKFQENENEDLNIQETVPSSSNPEIDGITNSINDVQYNNNYQNQKKIIYQTKSTVKPTIVNNFFISSPDGQNKNNSLENDFKYNLFVVNDYNNKINPNIPTLITKTYKSPENELS